MPPDHLLNAEPFKKMELALVSLENFFQRASHGSAEEMYGAGAAVEPSPDLTLGEMNSAPMDTSINQQSSAGLSPFSSTTEQAHFPSSLADSVSYAPSPILTLSDINEEAHRTAEVDMNSETTTGDTSQETTSETEDMPAKVNDVFWERFLTGEAESGRQHANNKSEATEAKEDIKIAIDWSILNHQNNVDQITEKMGHLDSAENGSDATGND